jgi:hypothetical protein
MQVSMTRCKRRLGVLWFAWSGLLFVLLTLQTVFGRYGSNADEAWGWLLPGILPTLSVIISVLVMDTLGQSVKVKSVDNYFFRLTFSLCSFYLMMVTLSIILQPFAALDPLALVKQSSLWLGPLQGLVSAALVAFFTKRETS